MSCSDSWWKMIWRNRRIKICNENVAPPPRYVWCWDWRKRNRWRAEIDATYSHPYAWFYLIIVVRSQYRSCLVPLPSIRQPRSRTPFHFLPMVHDPLWRIIRWVDLDTKRACSLDTLWAPYDLYVSILKKLFIELNLIWDGPIMHRRRQRSPKWCHRPKNLPNLYINNLMHAFF